MMSSLKIILRFCAEQIFLKSIYISLLAYYNPKILFQFFYNLNVNFQLLFSQFNYKRYRYNDVGLKKHAQINTDEYKTPEYKTSVFLIADLPCFDIIKDIIVPIIYQFHVSRPMYKPWSKPKKE